MFVLKERLNAGTSNIATFGTFDEAERYILERAVVC